MTVEVGDEKAVADFDGDDESVHLADGGEDANDVLMVMMMMGLKALQ